LRVKQRIARTIPAHHQSVAIVLDFVNPERAGRRSGHLRRLARFDEAGGTPHGHAAIVPFVATAVAQAMRWYDAEKPGASRMAIGNAIRLMCRAKKSREGDHFAAAIGLREQLEGYVPTIPDWANDKHTLAGRKLGRGLDHFRKEGAKLVLEPTEPDLFVEEAYRLWAIKQQGKGRRGPIST
jgi:hypothetical protein